VAQTALDEAKSTFVTSIGRTKLRENVRSNMSVSVGSGGNEIAINNKSF
jgi:hypothetical protein